MKKSRFSEANIASILKKHEAGVSSADICLEYGITQATFNNWKSKYDGMEVREIKRLKELEAENARLKKMNAKISMENIALRDLVEIKF